MDESSNTTPTADSNPEQNVIPAAPTMIPVLAPDPAVRFRGLGTNFRAKLIGMDDVPDSRGDQMCQESILKLKAAVRASGRHKQKIIINVSLEGIKVVDVLTGEVQHVHPVHRISFIARDLTDRRAFGYVYGAGEGRHQFFGIKTAKAAEILVLALRDLFQVVYDMKKKEIEEAKEGNMVNGNEEDNEDEPQAPVPAPRQQQIKNEAVYAVPNKQKQEGNLFDLEQQLTTIQEGINNIDAIGPWPQDLPTSPDSTAGDLNSGDLFGIASNSSNNNPPQKNSYSDELFHLASPVVQPPPQPGARLTKEQIISGFGAQQQGMFPGQPGMMMPPQGAIQYNQNFQQQMQGFPPAVQQQMQGFPPAVQQHIQGFPPAAPPMGMFTNSPSPAIPPRPGAMRPAMSQPLPGGAVQNPFGDSFSSGAPLMLAPVNTDPIGKEEPVAQAKSDPFAGLISGLGGPGAASKKDMFKNFQMAKPPQPPPRTNPPVNASNDLPVRALAAKPASDFENYFLNSVGGVPISDDAVTNNTAPTQQSSASDPFGFGSDANGQTGPPAAADPFGGNQTFSQPFDFNQVTNNTQSLFG